VSEPIVASGLTKYYGAHPGVIDLDLSVTEGEVFGFLGPNGAGKTTTIRLLMGLTRPTRGRMLVLGRRSDKNRMDLLRNIGYLPGEFGLYGDLTGNEYLSFLMKLRNRRINPRHVQRLSDLKRSFDIDYDKRIGACSKGMRQILGIIQAFMHDPPLLILDEPTSGLDPVMQERFSALIMREKEDGRTVFLSSHILAEVERLCDRVGFIKGGRLVAVEKLESRRSIGGKKVRISVRDDPHLAVQGIGRLSGVRKLEVDGDTIRFYYGGSADALLECAAAMKVKDFSCETPTVEDFFIGLYGS
jgi:ABC-2 type transport system ATP-binding protein